MATVPERPRIHKPDDDPENDPWTNKLAKLERETIASGRNLGKAADAVFQLAAERLADALLNLHPGEFVGYLLRASAREAGLTPEAFEQIIHRATCEVFEEDKISTGPDKGQATPGRSAGEEAPDHGLESALDNGEIEWGDPDEDGGDE